MRAPLGHVVASLRRSALGRGSVPRGTRASPSDGRHPLQGGAGAASAKPVRSRMASSEGRTGVTPRDYVGEIERLVTAGDDQAALGFSATHHQAGTAADRYAAPARRMAPRERCHGGHTARSGRREHRGGSHHATATANKANTASAAPRCSGSHQTLEQLVRSPGSPARHKQRSLPKGATQARSQPMACDPLAAGADRLARASFSSRLSSRVRATLVRVRSVEAAAPARRCVQQQD